MRRKMLPTCKPINATYPGYSNVFSILQTNSKAIPWLFAKSMNVYVCRDYEQREQETGQIFWSDFYDEFSPLNQYVFESCPFLESQRLDRELVEQK